MSSCNQNGTPLVPPFRIHAFDPLIVNGEIVETPGSYVPWPLPSVAPKEKLETLPLRGEILEDLHIVPWSEAKLLACTGCGIVLDGRSSCRCVRTYPL